MLFKHEGLPITSRFYSKENDYKTRPSVVNKYFLYRFAVDDGISIDGSKSRRMLMRRINQMSNARVLHALEHGVYPRTWTGAKDFRSVYPRRAMSNTVSCIVCEKEISEFYTLTSEKGAPKYCDVCIQHRYLKEPTNRSII